MGHAPPPPPSLLQRMLPFIALVAAGVGVPSAVVTFFHDRLLAHPWLTAIGFVVYEVVVLVVGFVLQVGQKLQGRWVDRVADWSDALILRRLSGYARKYSDYIRYQHRDFDVKGLTTLGTYSLELDQIFVDLRLDPATLKDVSVNPLATLKPLTEERHSLWTYLEAPQLRGQHLVIIGPPGSGKTTLLKYVALKLVARRWWQFWLRKGTAGKLPILLSLRDHAENISSKEGFSLPHALREHLKKWEQPDPPAGWIEKRLTSGHCLVMLDGLDEVADVETRKKVVDWVQRQMVAFPQNRFLISSRPFGYKSNPLSRVAVLEVRPFSQMQVEQFVQKWYLANESMSKQKLDEGVRMKARSEAKELLRRLNAAPALFALTVNPLLLTMIVTVHRYTDGLPGTRVELYKEICEVFLGKRQQARGQTLALTSAQMQLVLGPLAYEMMLSGKREVTFNKACDAIRDMLARVKPDMAGEAFLQLVQNVSGLLLEQENAQYGFAHLTFQEYLAAVYIREKGLVDILVNKVGESWWRETIRLYCAMGDATPIIATCLRDNLPPIPALSAALVFAEEARDIDPQVKARMDDILNNGVEQVDAERRRIVVEALLARRLRHQMVEVREGVYRTTSLVTCAEYQLFLDERCARDRYHQPDHWSNFTFPKGSGLSPILGMRRSDAIAFCSWLTERDEEGWQYRLPLLEEWPLEQREMVLPADTGYWIEDKVRFAWSQGKPSDNLWQHIAHHTDSALAHIRALVLTLDSTLALTLDSALARARPLDSALALTLDSALAHVHVRSIRIRALALTLVRAPDSVLDSALDSVLALALDSILTRSHDRELALDLYITLFLLQRRSAGELPAWEGILLVKERKRSEKRRRLH